jgi:uncharacterized coiled-coil protein SlyX
MPRWSPEAAQEKEIARISDSVIDAARAYARTYRSLHRLTGQRIVGADVQQSAVAAVTTAGASLTAAVDRLEAAYRGEFD